MGLIKLIQSGFHKLSIFQRNNLGLMVIIILAITTVLGYGITKVTIESGFAELNPKDLPVTKLNTEVARMFSTQEAIVVIVELDESIDSINPDIPRDIRNPEVMEFLVRLEKNLRSEPIIDSVQSIGSVFIQSGIPESLNEVKSTLSQVPGAEGSFSKDYSFTVLFVEANVGTSTDQLDAANEKVDEIISLSSPPAGINTVVTGDPALGSALFRLLINDAFNVMIYAIILIFLLLIITEFSIKRAVTIMVPLLFGLTWTLGALGWADIPITVGTAGLSAMLLGLGVEYAIFLFARYKEERKSRPVEESIDVAISNVGASIFSSGGTTAIGFFALALSMFPVLSDLGLSLGIGILMLLAATIGITPVVILIEERLSTRFFGEKYHKQEEKLERTQLKKPSRFEKAYEAYGDFASRRPWLMLFIAAAATLAMFYGLQQINSEDFNFETVLPEDMPELNAFTKISDEFGETASIRIYVELNPTSIGSDEPKDIRDPRILKYIDVLAQKSQYIDNAEEVNSISQIVKSQNDGIIPDTIASQISLFESPLVERFINSDYSGSLIRITLDEEAQDNRPEIIRQLNEIIDTTEQPPGIKATVVGSLAVEEEQSALMGPDSSRTSLIALVAIIVFLYILTRTVKSTILPLVTVILGVIWTLGLVGFLQIPFTNITSSVITMTIGIGIDFGLQLMTRFEYELKSNKKREAMKKTLAGVLPPMIITVLAALIGFRAMNFGELALMADLGNTMSVAITASMLASITGVAALILILQREKGTKKSHKSL